MNKFKLYLPALLLCWSAQAQEPAKKWSLEECINYAIEHNIDLKQKVQDQESKKSRPQYEQEQLAAQPECRCGTELRLWPFAIQNGCDC